MSHAVAHVPAATRALLTGIQDPVQQQANPTEETWEDFADAVTELAAESAEPQPSAFQHGHAATPSVAGQVPVGNLTGADLMRWTATAAPTTLPLIAGTGLKTSTRQEHRRLLLHLRTWILGYEKEPLAIAVVKAIMRRRSSQKWRWSSTLKTMAAAQGACTLMPMYHSSAPSLHLGHCVIWKQAMRAIARKAREELPKQPLAASWAQVSTALRSAHCLVTFSAIMLAWCTAARVGCTTQLMTNEVQLEATGEISVTFSRGKGASMRGQTYTVHSKVDLEFVPRLQRFLRERSTHPHLFPGGTDWGVRVRTQLRTVEATLEQRSLRRGSLQALSRSPTMTDEMLLLFSGHSSILTLRRYLSFGRKATHTQRAMRSAMGNASGRRFGGAALYFSRTITTATTTSSSTRPHEAWPKPEIGDFVTSLSSIGDLFAVYLLAPLALADAGVVDECERRRSEEPGAEDGPEQNPRQLREVAPICLRGPNGPPRYLSFLGIEAPDHRDLASKELPRATREEKRSWPRHLKDVVASLDLDGISKLSSATCSTKEAYVTAIRLTSEELLQQLVLRAEAQGGRTRRARPSSMGSIDDFLRVHKFEEAQGDAADANSTVFELEEAAKIRWRVLMETILLNDAMSRDDLAGIKLPQNALLREMAMKKYFLALDAQAFFDQIPLSRKVRRFFTFAHRGRLLQSCVLPMGYRGACDVAQAIAMLLMDVPSQGVMMTAYIDNFFWASDDAAALKSTVSAFLERCTRVGLALNVPDEINTTELKDLTARAKAARGTDEYQSIVKDLRRTEWATIEQNLDVLMRIERQDVLGEHFNRSCNTRSCTTSTIQKLTAARRLVERPKRKPSWKQREP